MINFCTLFDKNYLDKALAMYNSLIRAKTDFCLYVLCFDDTAYEILDKMQLPRLVLEKLVNFETEELLKLKKERSKAEYCWTCTGAAIEHFICKFHLSNCTYIDADLYFYSDPTVLIDELGENTIGIIEHRFGTKKSDLKLKGYSGKYCVEFNYFDNSPQSMAALRWWKEQCFEWCYHKYEAKYDGVNDRYGDQKYLEQFASRFEGVHEFAHLGAGLALWNLKQYKLVEDDFPRIRLQHESGQEVDLVFYHFQNFKYISSSAINVNTGCKDKKLKRAIYYPYIYEITKIREMLEKEYGLKMTTKKSYSSNKVKAFIQKYIMPYKVRTLSDIMKVKKVLKENEKRKYFD